MWNAHLSCLVFLQRLTLMALGSIFSFEEPVLKDHCSKLRTLVSCLSGLPGMLFSLLDNEVDPAMISNIHDTINSIMHSMVAENLSSWLALCREVRCRNFLNVGELTQIPPMLRS